MTLIEQILEAGRWAASASNRQPWTFIVIRDKEIHKAVAQHAAFFFVQQAHVDDAPVIIALCGDAKNRVYRQFLHEDIGIAGTQMMLQAAALGLGTCWIGGMQRKAIGDVLGLPPDLEMVGLLTLGYPDEDPGACEAQTAGADRPLRRIRQTIAGCSHRQAPRHRAVGDSAAEVADQDTVLIVRRFHQKALLCA